MSIATTIMIFNLYLVVWVWVKVLSFILSLFSAKPVQFLPFLFGDGETISMPFAILTGILVVLGWLISTRVKFYQTPIKRVWMFTLVMMYLIGAVCYYGISRLRLYVFPFLEVQVERASGIEDTLAQLAVGQSEGFFFILGLAPLIVVGFVCFYFISKYRTHEEDLKKAFFEFEWKGKYLQAFSNLEETEYYPDVELGRDVNTNEMVVLKGFDRTLNTSITGPIGTGKTAALGLPTLNADLNHMTKFINEFKELYEKENYKSEEVSGHYLSGISVIDPSNDLCKKVYKLAKAHNIPDEAITYIDPTNPNTPTLNPLRGPVDKVAEVFTQVISGLGESNGGGNQFFQQAQRTHLKHYIYLLKTHNPNLEVTFDMLLDMYNNPQVAHAKHVALKTRFPDDMEIIEDRDERNYWQILKGIDEWFDLTLVPKMVRQGSTLLPEMDSQGNPLYMDMEAEYVKGLRNILNDIGSNPLIRRVMFGKSNFDFDRHMEVGGILLVNTAKGELEELNRVLGKIILMNLQNATFRREPGVSTFHHIFVDEAPEFLYPAFRSFPAQSRKYKVIITILKQTITQLADLYGEYYMETLMATMRNKMFYGDLPGFDAKYFSEMTGEKTVFTESETESGVSALQESPMNRSGSTYSKTTEQAYSASDLIYQDKFQCAVRIVNDNTPMPTCVIKANFVPQSEFVEAKHRANDEANQYWLAIRQEYGERYNTEFEQEEQLVAIDEVQARELEDEAAINGDSPTDDYLLRSNSQVNPTLQVQYSRYVPVSSLPTALPGMKNVIQEVVGTTEEQVEIVHRAEERVSKDVSNVNQEVPVRHKEKGHSGHVGHTSINHSQHEINTSVTEGEPMAGEDIDDSLFEDGVAQLLNDQGVQQAQGTEQTPTQTITDSPSMDQPTSNVNPLSFTSDYVETDESNTYQSTELQDQELAFLEEIVKDIEK